MYFDDVSTIEYKDLERLVEYCISESRTIDFKQALDIRKTSAKKKFLDDVSAFANSSGGYIIFGIHEKDAVASSVVGFVVESVDELTLGIEQLMRDGLEPSLPLTRLNFVDCPDGKKVLIIEVEESLLAPHRVVLDGGSKFFSRANGGNFPMDVESLRASFLRSEKYIHKLRSFRLERLASLDRDEGPFPIREGPKLVFHLVPLRLEERDLVDFSKDQSAQILRTIGGGGNLPTPTFDGIAAQSSTSDQGQAARSYSLLFRNGAAEAVVSLSQSNTDRQCLSVNEIDQYVAQGLFHFSRFVDRHTSGLPMFAMISLLNVKSFWIGEGQMFEFRYCALPYFNRKEHILIPERQVEPVAQLSEAYPQVKPILDHIWNSFGFPRAISFDNAGNYTGIN